MDVARIPESEWVWHGMAGHFCAACRFHLATEVGNFRVSTIGAYVSPLDKENYSEVGKENYSEVGFQRKYETMVFRIADGQAVCTCGCQMKDVEPWTELEMLPANDPDAARKNHMEACLKYAAHAMQGYRRPEVE